MKQGGNLDSALAGSTRAFASTGEILSLGSFVAGSGYTPKLSAVTFTGGTGTALKAHFN